MSNKSNSYDYHAALYQRARRGDTEAVLGLQKGTLRLLRGSLCSKVFNLPSWEVGEICEDAFVEILQRFTTIGTWSQAWRYVEKAALSRARRCAHRRRNQRSFARESGNAARVEAARPVNEVDLWDSVQRFVAHEDSDLVVLLVVIADCCGRGDSPTVKRLAQRSHASPKTVRRRLAHVRERMGHWLGLTEAAEGSWNDPKA